MATYTVKSGDSLSRIALNVLGDMSLWPRIAQANGLAAPYTIYPGQVLQLPGVTKLMPRPITTMPITINRPSGPFLPAPGLPPGSTTGAGGGILQWVMDNKLLVGGLLVGVAVIALLATQAPKRRKRRGPESE